jgi:hypothetical protein
VSGPAVARAEPRAPGAAPPPLRRWEERRAPRATRATRPVPPSPSRLAVSCELGARSARGRAVRFAVELRVTEDEARALARALGCAALTDMPVPRHAVAGGGASVAGAVAPEGGPHVPLPVSRALLAWLGGLLVQAGGGRTPAERALAAPAAPAERPRPAVRFGDVEVYPEAHRVTRAGEPVALRPKALALLLALAAQPGRTLSRGALLREVWGYQGDTASRTVDTHMAELRRKLERDPARPAHLVGVRTVGYQLRL